jgi:hypothetical protein
VLPPVVATRAVERLRALLSWLMRAISPPPVQIVDGAVAGLDQVALGAMLALDIPDRLVNAGTVDELAAAADADVDLVERIVNYGAARGWLRVDRRGRIHATGVTRFLRRDHPGGWRAWVELVNGTEVHAAMARFAALPTTGAFEAANGKPFFEWMEHHPDRHAVFDRAMSSAGYLHGHALASAVSWSSTDRVCDVGGGTGATLRVLLERHPHLRGVLFDLPPVVARAAPHDRLTIVDGDAFAGVPSGCDTYLLVNVLHAWTDDDAGRLLGNVATAGGRDARIVVVDAVRPRRPRDRLAMRIDMHLLIVAPGGRVRTVAEQQSLATRAGLVVRRVTWLASGDAVYELSRR